jgi:hypothetical protein
MAVAYAESAARQARQDVAALAELAGLPSPGVFSSRLTRLESDVAFLKLQVTTLIDAVSRVTPPNEVASHE